jgi:hypothetical protein
VTGGRRKIPIEELCNCYSSQYIIPMIKSKMRWAGLVAQHIWDVSLTGGVTCIIQNKIMCGILFLINAKCPAQIIILRFYHPNDVW